MENISNKLKIGMIITILIPIIILLLFLIGLSKVEAESLQCDQGLKLNGTNVTTQSTTQLSANTNYTIQMIEPGVIGNNVYVGGKYYTDYLVVTNIGFGNYTGTNNGNAFSLLNTNTTSNALGFGTNDGIWRIRVLWTAQDTIDQPDGRILAYGYTTTNWGGSVNYLGGMRVINVTCGEQAKMPTNAETDAALIKAFKDLQSIISATNGAQIGALNGIENAINGGNATNRQYQQATTDAINDMANQDIDNTTKQPVDNTNVNNYNTKEAALMNTATQTNLNDVNIGIDSTASGNIWQLITRILNTNAKVFGLVISILSIGIIKLMLSR